MSRDVETCPVCGGVALAPIVSASPLLSISDYLVQRVLAKVGILLTRGGVGGRSTCRDAALAARHAGLRPEDCWLAYPAPPAFVDKAITAASDDWRVVALMLDDHVSVSSRRVQATLTDYVHEIVADRTPHARDLLRGRLHDDLGVLLHDAGLERISA